MTIEYVMSIGTLLLSIYLLIGFSIELFILVKDYNNGTYINGDKIHSIEHIEYVSTYLLASITFYSRLIGHEGFKHFFYSHLMYEYGFIVLFLMGISSRILLKHIKKERLGIY